MKKVSSMKLFFGPLTCYVWTIILFLRTVVRRRDAWRTKDPRAQRKGKNVLSVKSHPDLCNISFVGRRLLQDKSLWILLWEQVKIQYYPLKIDFVYFLTRIYFLFKCTYVLFYILITIISTTGAIGVGALNCNCSFIGMELDQRTFFQAVHILAAQIAALQNAS